MCEECNSFREFYEEYGKPIIFDPPISLSRDTINEEIAAQKLLDNTPDKIAYRGKYSILRTTNFVKKVDGEDIPLLKTEWKNKSKEFSEKRPHAGYIIYDPHSKDLKIFEVFCDCCNFNFYWYAPLVRADLATFDLEPKYRRRDQLRFKATGVGRHNKQWTKKTNPSGTLAVCKHLFCIINSYLIGHINIANAKKALPLDKDKKLKEPVKKAEPIKEPEKKAEPPKVAPKKAEPIKEPVKTPVEKTKEPVKKFEKGKIPKLTPQKRDEIKGKKI